MLGYNGNTYAVDAPASLNMRNLCSDIIEWRAREAICRSHLTWCPACTFQAATAGEALHVHAAEAWWVTHVNHVHYSHMDLTPGLYLSTLPDRDLPPTTALCCAW